MLHYRFEVIYQTKKLKDASDFLSKCDLHIGEICRKEAITFTSENAEKPISYFKDLIKQAIELDGGHLVKIAGGKVE